MKKTLLFAFAMLTAGVSAQEHFSGINTSRRVGILNAAINPAEFANLKNDHEVNIFNFSANVANNKITFGDLVNGEDFEDKIFDGDEAANLRADVAVFGPSFAMKRGKWAFGITSGANIKAGLVDIDVNLGDALTQSASGLIVAESVPIETDYNQRATATSWGEIGLSLARELFNSEEHRFTAGATVKLLFPGSYANMSADRFSGIVTRDLTGNVELTDAYANLNIAYSGSLAEDFSDSSNYSQFFAGGLNGFGADLGVSYQWKNPEDGTQKLNAGLAIRNIGSMTFKDDNNVSRNYTLQVEEGESLDLNQFEDAESLTDVEAILLNNPEFFTAEVGQKDFKVNLPTVFSAYADYNIYNKWFVTAYTQQKLNEDNDNDQIGIQNVVTVTPRYSGDFFEAYTPLSHNEISGFTAGIGFRLGGFFIGSGSALTAIVSDVDQADAYFGFRFGF
jgi:hypothetical protein